MILALKILLLVAVVLGLYAGYVWASAYAYVKQLPRKQFFICDKHGPISKEYVLHFQTGPNDFQDYCSLCFHENMLKAEHV